MKPSSMLACAALLLIACHLRYLLFVPYGQLAERPLWVSAFYFFSGLSHQAFAVYFVIQGHALARAVRESPSYVSLLVRKAAVTWAMLLPILLLGVLLDGSGLRWLNASGLYTAFPDFIVFTFDGPTLLGQLAMLQPFVVPTFGSNAVLWVLAFEWWYSCLYLLLASQLWRGRAVALVLIGLGVALALAGFSSEFVTWGVVWLLGAALAVPRIARLRVPPRLAIALFAGALLLSRYIEGQAGWLQGTHGLAVIFCKNVLFGAGFALLLLALPRRAEALAPSFSGALFFGHFPVLMVLVGLGALWQPLKRQPDGATMLWFGALTVAVYAIGWLLFAATRRLLSRRYRRRSPALP